jgi:DNA invertase Pin-like site-specific DNA recombinase
VRAVIYSLQVGQAPHAAAAELQDLAQRRGWQVVAVHTDAVGRMRAPREQRKRVVELLASGEADVLVVWRLADWARTLPELAGLANRIAAGQHLCACADEIDTTDPLGVGRWRQAGKLLGVWWGGLLADAAQLSEEAGRRRPGKPPRRFAPINPDELAALWNGGLTRREISRRLGHAAATVGRHLERAAAAGLIDAALHARALEARGRSHRPGRPKRGRVSLAPWRPPARERAVQRAACPPGGVQDFGGVEVELEQGRGAGDDGQTATSSRDA